MCKFLIQKKALTFYSQSLICHCNALVLLRFIILPYKTSAFSGRSFLFNSVNTIPAQKLKKFFEKSVTFFIFADYICRIVDNKKSLFSHVLSILLHRRLHRTQFCIIIYPEKASVWQNILPPVPHIRGLKMTTTSLLLCKRSGRGHTSARCATLRSGR